MCLYGSSQGDQSTALPKMPHFHSTTRIRTVPMHASSAWLSCEPCDVEWVCMLFLHMVSNVQAWADTVEIMLKCQGYSFRKSHSFHHHFNNALIHYQMLIQLVEAEMTWITNGVHPSASSDEAATGTTAAGITPTLDKLTPI